jgi:chorismate dehydratase
MRSKPMNPKIGRMPYLNSEIFYLNIDPKNFDLIYYAPKEMGEEINNGNLHGGPLSLVDSINCKKSIEFLPFVVSTDKKSNSVLLFSKVPYQKLNRKRISITNDTSTSVKLLEVILNRFWDVEEINFTDEKENSSNAKLLIGDKALEQLYLNNSWPFVYDLGEIWYKMTSLQFVFARWAILTSVNTKIKNILKENISKSIIEKSISIEKIITNNQRKFLTNNNIKEYISSFNYEYNSKHVDAINEFQNLLSKNKLKITS